MRRRVVITGLGAVTAHGEGAEALWRAALEGRSGVGPVEGFGGLKALGAAIRDFDAEKFVSQRKALKVMARDIQLAVAAASLALEHAGARDGGKNPSRSGILIGSGVLDHELEELAYCVQNSLGEDGRLDLRKFGSDGLSALFPLWLLKYLPNMPACHISILFDLQGPNNTITTGASASMQAVGEAVRIIERGAADFMLAGGAESKLNPVGLGHYQALGVLSRLNGKPPAKVYRPLDAEGSGLVIGEAAAFVALEELEHARRRNAAILAEVAGFGASSSDGREVAMRCALEDAGLSPERISFVQASGLGIPEEDSAETLAIESVFRQTAPSLWVSASKAVTGFAGFSAGALDLVISTLALKNGLLPPAVNFERSARPLKFRVAKDEPVRGAFTAAMTNSFGLSGQSASLVTRAWGERA